MVTRRCRKCGGPLVQVQLVISSCAPLVCPTCDCRTHVQLLDKARAEAAGLCGDNHLAIDDEPTRPLERSRRP